MLNTCNPLTGVPDTSPGCAQYRLTLPNPPTSVEGQLSDTQAQAVALQRQINRIQVVVLRLTTTAQDECAGITAPGTSGAPGNGARCAQDWAQVNAYKNSNGLAADLQLLGELNAKIATLTAQVETAKASYSTVVQAAISGRMAEIKSAMQGQIGLIDEWNALQELSARNGIVNVAAWFIRMTFVVLDCLPITAKLMGGETAYDRRLFMQLKSDESIHEIELESRAQRERASRKPEVRRSPECRHDKTMAKRLNAFLAENPGMRRPDALQQVAEEGIRMAEHPVIRFMPGPAGRRRATLIGGPEVWEIIRELRFARSIRPRLSEDAVLAEVAQKTETSPDRIRAAVRYAKAYPAEIAEQIDLAKAAERYRERSRAVG
jgi:Domain of unknown function (DUF4407)